MSDSAGLLLPAESFVSCSWAFPLADGLAHRVFNTARNGWIVLT